MKPGNLTLGRKTGERGNTKRKCEHREGEKRGRRGQFYREEPLWEGQPSVWAGEFRVEGGVGQLYPVTGSNRGMLGEPKGQIHFGM